MPHPTALVGELLHRFPALDRRFEAVVFDWDGTAVPDRAADTTDLRRAIEELCALGMDMIVVTGTHVGNVDGQLRARLQGPGRLHLCLNRGAPRSSRNGSTGGQRAPARRGPDARLSKPI
jgi:hypothetical protein